MPLVNYLYADHEGRVTQELLDLPYDAKEFWQVRSEPSYLLGLDNCPACNYLQTALGGGVKHLHGDDIDKIVADFPDTADDEYPVEAADLGKFLSKHSGAAFFIAEHYIEWWAIRQMIGKDGKFHPPDYW